jgi:1-acyl-sn-glycerol-3-phosphate acyltransferase
MLNDKKHGPVIAHQYISRNWARTLFFFFGVRLKVKNKHLLDKKQTYVFVANHLSQLDIPADAIATDHSFKFLAKEELTKIPIMGYIIRNLYITVNRKDKIARARSMENMQRQIRDGISVFIFPEGTRNKGNEPLLDFRDGAFRLAIEAQVPVAVLTLLNTGKLLSPNRAIELSPGTIECVWSEPVPTDGMTLDDIPQLKEKVIGLMIANLRR